MLRFARNDGDNLEATFRNRFGLIETVLILASFLRRYRFVAESDRPVFPFPPSTLRPKGGVWSRRGE